MVKPINIRYNYSHIEKRMVVINMKRVRIGHWEIEHDKIATQNAYALLPTIVQNCNCISCRNYYNACMQFPNEVLDFFSSLGTDPAKAAEIYDCGVFENGKLQYGGFYHIMGNVLSGEDVWQPVGTNHNVQAEMLRLADDYEIGFSYATDLVDENFPRPVCQIEIAFRVPWVIAEPYPQQ